MLDKLANDLLDCFTTMPNFRPYKLRSCRTGLVLRQSSIDGLLLLESRL